MHYRSLCLLALTILLSSTNGQVSIEVYDADLFASRVNPKVYNPKAKQKNESMKYEQRIRWLIFITDLFVFCEEPVAVNVSLFLDRFGPYDDTKSVFPVLLF